jgi:hypothetical protein
VKVSKSFLEPLGANDDLLAEKLINEEYIIGIKPGPNGTPKRTPVEIQLMENINQKLRENYNWTEKTNFGLVAAQKCSDMIVEVCKFIEKQKILPFQLVFNK